MQMSLFGCATITLALAATFMPRDARSASNALRCAAGQVTREAYAGDTVCVDFRRRNDVRVENAAALMRVQQGGGAFGRDTCIQGFVWRVANAADHVCVTPGSRDLVARENAAQIGMLRQRLAQRQRDLAKAKEDARRIEQHLREEDAKFARENPGLGRSTQPSIADNVSPIAQDIRQIEAALKAAESASASPQPPRPAQPHMSAGK